MRLSRSPMIIWLFWVTRTPGTDAFSSSLPSRQPASQPSTKEPSNKATQIMQGAGVAQVDLNQYNLESLEQIAEEWTANLRQKTAEKKITVKLGVKNDQDLFVDTVQVLSAQRKHGQGLGLELLELAGGREDGLGITVVSTAPSGICDGLDILPGDSISQITLLRRRNRGTEQQSAGSVQEYQEAIPVRTDCLSYDATVEGILSLPEFDERFVDFFEVTLKRIRRKPKVSIKLQYPPDQHEEDNVLELFAGENLRMGMLMRGVKLNDPLAKRFDTKNGGNCGAGGLCRTCAVTVVNGADILNPQRPAEKQMLADNPRWRLACKAIVGYGMKEGEMTIRVNPRQF